MSAAWADWAIFIVLLGVVFALSAICATLSAIHTELARLASALGKIAAPAEPIRPRPYGSPPPTNGDD